MDGKNHEVRRGDHEVLPQAVSDRVLARASELDAALRSGASVAQLRTAALEAGISEGAFEAALAEVGREGPVATAAPHSRRRLVRVLASIGAFVLLFLGATLLVRTAVPGRIPASVEVLQEPILLRCLAFRDAEVLLRPMLRSASEVRFSTVDKGRVLVLSATAEQIAEAKALIEKEEARIPACAIPSAPATRGTATP